MLRKISLGLLILSSVAFLTAAVFFIEHLVTFREIRFVPVDIPITLQATSQHQFNLTVDEPAEYIIALRIPVHVIRESSRLGDLFDSLAEYLDSTTITAMISSGKDSLHISRTVGVSLSSTPSTEPREEWYEVRTDCADLETAKVYSCITHLNSVAQFVVGRSARLQVQMLPAARKAIYVQNAIRYKTRQLGLVVGGTLLALSIGFRWLVIRWLPQRSR